ncbi:hypothetical protein [Paenibacillus sp. 22594]|uniref:hypothetical protein n=1 Tax=Paenibacillus sp. 22594 TaxID=3453947 RepID=UPI003F86FF64
MSNKNIKAEESAGPNAGILEVLHEVETVIPQTEIGNVPAESEKVVSQIYLGPNLSGGRLLQSTVFRGGIPAYLQTLLDEQPDVAALIVPVGEIAGVQARIVQTGTPEYGSYQAILKRGEANGV